MTRKDAEIKAVVRRHVAELESVIADAIAAGADGRTILALKAAARHCRRVASNPVITGFRPAKYRKPL